MKKNLFLMSLQRVAMLVVVAFAVLVTPSSPRAAEGGYTNYIPGLYGDFGVAVAPDPGFYLRTDLYYYAADKTKERFVQGGKIRAELDLDVAMLMVTGLKVLDKQVLGGRYAFAAFVPLSSTDLSGRVSTGAAETPFDSDRTAIGDMGIMPVSLYWNFDRFHINAYETITMPTGSYDKDRDVNAGLNYWSFDSNLAMTYFNEKKGWELSTAIGYIYNTENNDTRYQTGQEFHLDYMANQFLSETFAMGLQGFYYKQVTGDSGSGALLGDFKGEAAGIGPAIMWATKIKETDLIVNLKWLYEFHAEHRLEGNHLFLNATLVF